MTSSALVPPSRRIAAVRARRVWDSRGRPTVEVDVETASGAVGRAIAPAGASTGSGEAVDLRDGGQAFGGLDVRRALEGLSREIAPSLVGADVSDQPGLDARLIALDGTPDRSRLGGNALVATSMAIAHAAAAASGRPLWAALGDGATAVLPLPEIQVFGGGAHAGGRLDLQDFMVVAVGADDWRTALDWTAEVYRAAGRLLADAGRLQGVADEGGFWPAFDDHGVALETLVRAIEAAGLRPGGPANSRRPSSPNCCSGGCAAGRWCRSRIRSPRTIRTGSRRSPRRPVRACRWCSTTRWSRTPRGSVRTRRAAPATRPWSSPTRRAR